MSEIRPPRTEQEHKSETFWDKVARTESHGALHGLMEADADLGAYRDAAEKRVLYARHGERLRGRLLEIGCGGGRWTVDLARQCDRVVATDISSAMVDRARARVAEAGLDNVEVRAGAIEEMAFADDEKFDVVYLGSCLHYMSDEAVTAGLAAVARAATDDCLLISRDTVSLIGRTFDRRERYATGDPAIYRPIAFYEQAVAPHGWRLVDEWRTWVKPLTWRVRWLLPRVVLRRLLALELQLAPFEVRHAQRLQPARDKCHKFFVYER